MRLYRLVAEHEAVGDLLVREACRDEAENLNLAGREGVEIPRVGALRRAEARELGDQAPRYGWREERIAGGDDSYRVEQCLRAGRP